MNEDNKMICFYWVCNIVKSANCLSQLKAVDNLINNFNKMFNDKELLTFLNNYKYTSNNIKI